MAYLAQDRQRGDQVVVKELAPDGSKRDADGLLDLEGLGAASVHRLRRCFLDEAQLLSRLNLPGVVNVRTYGTEAGSAYYVTDYCADAEPLDELLRRVHRLPVEGALDLGFQLMDTLQGVHQRGILHRDIKPANVLLRKNGQTILIDFGAAREWHADMTEHHTVLFTPGFAPIEQLSERAKRGPATDIYGLAALMYTLLAGFPPVPATDRLNGIPMQPLSAACPALDAQSARAIEAGLALNYAERPQSVSEFRALFDESVPGPVQTPLDRLDATLEALQHMSFGRRECPACGDVLHIASPLPKHRCPVCDRGTIKPRPIHTNVCPACRLGILIKTPNTEPPAICPLCEIGLLHKEKAKMFSRDFNYACGECESLFEQRGDQVTLARSQAHPELAGTTKPWTDWTAGQTRSHEVRVCDGCHAQFDLMTDGQWEQVEPKPELGKPSVLYPEEWARVAAGLDPSCGTHVCTACEADFFVEGDRVTLLDAHEDPFHFAEANMGRPLSWDSIRWLGVGKSSVKPGPACPNCGTEFDTEGEFLRLIRSNARPLANSIGSLQTFEDWHRIARGLPRLDEQAAFEKSVDDAILSAYLDGSLGFDDRGTLWKGQATRLSDNANGSLVITTSEVSFGGLLRKDKTLLELLASVHVNGNELELTFRGSAEPVTYEVQETELPVRLRSGERTAHLDASDLAARLQVILHTERTTV